jgi:hypothetical protein
MTQVALRPEAHSVGLSVGPLDALCSTKLLSFIVIARVEGWGLDTYTKHERGERGIGRAARKYAQALGVNEAWLLGLDDEDRRSNGAAAGLQMAINIVKEASVPAALNPHGATEQALKVVILALLEARLKELR